MNEFNPRVIFDRINTSGDRMVDGKELQTFLLNNNIKDITEEEAKQIVAEYDSSRDGMLNFDEFLQIVVPSTNIELKNKYISPLTRNEDAAEIHPKVLSVIIGILKLDVENIREKKELRKKLLQDENFDCRQAFNNVSKG